MTYQGRSIDDMPLAAYGGPGMDLSEEDAAKLASPRPPTPDSAAPAGATASGPRMFAAATELPDDNFGTGRPAQPRTLPPVVVKIVHVLSTSRLAAGAAAVALIAVGLLLGAGNQPGASGATATPTPP
ncbi:MAG TPA: hypothetical protein VNL94_09605, partial [Candidatus Binatia bacterium]|nr:hypothetical protein [Candidatus Binatia bacterium]